VDVVRDEGIHLTKKGNRFWGLCVFHSEKTPSFSVNPDKQTFYCFGCHEHGDVIHFLMKLRGITFKDALIVLGMSGRDNPPLPLPRGDYKRRRMIEEFHEWCRWYRHECLELMEIVDRIERAITDPAYLGLQAIAEVFLVRFIAQYHVWLLTGGFDNEDAFCIYKEFHGIT
jgi:DNA primase